MLASEIFIFIGGAMVLGGVAVFVVSFFMDLFSSDNYSQDNTSYSFDFNEHQNYWDADK